jgi:hypothetical protein
MSIYQPSLKISGLILTAIPKEMRGITTLVAIPQPPIEGVKITDGNKNVFSGKDGKYEITTEKQFLTFSKENYVSQTIDLHEKTNTKSNTKYVFLEKSGATTTETKSNSEEKMLFGLKQKFLINVALVLGVVGLGWYFYKSKKK